MPRATIIIMGGEMKRKIFGLAAVAGIGLWFLGPAAWPAQEDAGRDLYVKYCASCHGKDGRGKGPVTRYLKVNVPDLTLLRKKHKGVYPLANVMASIDGSREIRAHGDAEMPVWGEVFKKEAKGEKYEELTGLLTTKVIAEYISTLQR